MIYGIWRTRHGATGERARLLEDVVRVRDVAGGYRAGGVDGGRGVSVAAERATAATAYAAERVARVGADRATGRATGRDGVGGAGDAAALHWTRSAGNGVAEIRGYRQVGDDVGECAGARSRTSSAPTDEGVARIGCLCAGGTAAVGHVLGRAGYCAARCRVARAGYLVGRPRLESHAELAIGRHRVDREVDVADAAHCARAGVVPEGHDVADVWRCRERWCRVICHHLVGSRVNGAASGGRGSDLYPRGALQLALVPPLSPDATPRVRGRARSDCARVPRAAQVGGGCYGKAGYCPDCAPSRRLH